MGRLLLLFGLLPLLVPDILSARIDDESPRSLIIGGENAVDGRFPYAQISIVDSRWEEHYCMAVLVAPDVVMTAAHCVEGTETEVQYIEVNRYDFSDKKDEYEKMRALKIRQNPQWDAYYFRYDVALIQLNDMVRTARPVRLNSNTNYPVIGQQVTLVGFGSIGYYGNLYPDVLQTTVVETISNERCEGFTIEGEGQAYKDEIFPDMLCAFTVGKDACNGDSGGAMIVPGSTEEEDLLVSLVSWGKGCAQFPGVYSRVAASYSWISKSICRLSKDPPQYLGCHASQRNYNAPVASPATQPIHTLLPTEVSLQSPTALPTATKEGEDMKNYISLERQSLTSGADHHGWWWSTLSTGLGCFMLAY